MERTIVMAVRYVLDSAVAEQLLAQEPHLRALIKPERTLDTIATPGELQLVLSGALEKFKHAPTGPGNLVVLDFHMIDFVTESTRTSMPRWTARWQGVGSFAS